MNGLYNLVRVTTATTGTETITLGAAVSGFLTFAQAGVPDGAVVTYAIADGANSEIGQGTYTLSGTTLTRTTVYRSTGAANTGKITLSGSAQVFITPAAEDFTFTAGSVLFAGANGMLIQDNASLFWDYTNNRLGIGNAIPAVALDIGAAASAFRVNNLITDAANGEWFEIDWTTTENVVIVGTNCNGAGETRGMILEVGGVNVLDFGVTAAGWTFGDSIFVLGNFGFGTGQNIYWQDGSKIKSPADGVVVLVNAADDAFSRLCLGGDNSDYPALKRSSVTLQARLADDSDFAPVQGKLTTDTAYEEGVTSPTGFVVVYDSTGTAYKISAVAA